MNQSDDLAAALPGLLPRIWRFCLRLARDPDTAEELMVRACEKALERRRPQRAGLSPVMEVFSIVCFIWSSSEFQARLKGRGVAIESVDEPVSDPKIYNGLWSHGSSCFDDIVRAVDQLPDMQRIVFVLIVVENMNYQDVADVLDTSADAAANCFACARLAIGKHFIGRPARDVGHTPACAEGMLSAR